MTEPTQTAGDSHEVLVESHHESRGRSRVKPIWFMIYAIALFIALIAIYWPGLSAPFMLEDKWAIEENPAIASFSIATVLPYFQAPNPVAGRPLVSLSFALNYYFSKLSVFPWHLTNLVIHFANSCLLLLLLQLMIRAVNTRDVVASSLSRWSFLVVACWALHPICTEAVIYTSQRSELLCTTFSLATFCCFAANNRNPAFRWFVLAAISALLASLSKETAVSIPVIVVLLSIVLENSIKVGIGKALPFAFVTLLGWVGVALSFASGARSSSVGFDLGVNPWEYLVTQSWMICHYSLQVFIPTRLSLDYGTEVIVVSDCLPQLLLITVMVIGIAISLFVVPRFGAFAAIALVLLMPTSSFIPIISEVGADHRAYLFAFVVLSGVSLILSWCGFSRLPSTVLLSMGAVALLAFGIGAFQRTLVLRNTDLACEDAISKFPRNIRAKLFLSERLTANERFQEAYPLLEQCVAARANDDRFHRRTVADYLLAFVSAKTGRTFRASEIADQLIAKSDWTVDSSLYCGKTLLELGRKEEASRVFRAGLNRFPSSSSNLLREYIKISLDLDRLHLAMRFCSLVDQEKSGSRELNELCEKVYKAYPEFVKYWPSRTVELDNEILKLRTLLADVASEPADIINAFREAKDRFGENYDIRLLESSYWRRTNQTQVAINVLSDLILKNPYGAEAYNTLAGMIAKTYPDKAKNLLGKALLLDPDLAEGHVNLANILAREGKLDDAVEHLLLAAKLNPQLDAATKNLVAVRSMMRLKAKEEQGDQQK